MSLGRPTQPFYLETSILFFFEQLNKARIYNNLTKAMLYVQIKDHDSPHSQFFSGVSDMRWCLSNYSKSLENSVCFVHSFHVKKNINWHMTGKKMTDPKKSN